MNVFGAAQGSGDVYLGAHGSANRLPAVVDALRLDAGHAGKGQYPFPHAPKAALFSRGRAGPYSIRGCLSRWPLRARARSVREVAGEQVGGVHASWFEKIR